MVVAYLDIETNSKTASDGMVIAVGLIADGEPEVRFADSLEEERKALEWLGKKLEGCDTLVTWYGSGFDIPFLLTRAVAQGVDLTRLANVQMLDLCEWSRANLLLSSYSLEAVARFFGVKGGKGFKEFRGTELIALFKLVQRGDLESRKRIVEHCKEDILVLKLVHEKLKPLIERFGQGLPRRASKEG